MQIHKVLKILSHMTNFEERKFKQIHTPNFSVDFYRNHTCVSKITNNNEFIILTSTPSEVSVLYADYLSLLSSRYNGTTVILKNMITSEYINMNNNDVWFQLSSLFDIVTHEIIMVPEKLKVLKDIKITIDNINIMDLDLHNILVQFCDEFLNNTTVKEFINEEE